MRGHALALAAILACGTAPAIAQDELPDEVRRMTIAEYQELGFMVRAQIMRPVAKARGVGYTSLNACLIAAGSHPSSPAEGSCGR